MYVECTKTIQLDEIAEPIAHSMRLLKQTLTRKLGTYMPLKLSLNPTPMVFCGNVVPHKMFTALYHRFKVFQDLEPKFLSTAIFN